MSTFRDIYRNDNPQDTGDPRRWYVMVSEAPKARLVFFDTREQAREFVRSRKRGQAAPLFGERFGL